MNRKDKMSRIVLGFVKLTGILPAFALFKPKIYKMNSNCSRKLGKGAIIMSNHTSLLDFVLYVLSFPLKNLHFLMAEVLFGKNPMFSWFLYKLGGIFVDRDACNFSFIEKSLSVIDKGGTVVIFPQGRLPVGGKPFPFKPGIVLLALQTDAPIIPMYTDGNYGIFKRAHIMIGEKIYLRNMVSSANPSQEEILKLTAFLEETNYQLKTELEKRLAPKNGK